MRRVGIVAALAGVGVLVARVLAPKLHERMLAGCKRMFEQMPADFPPKRMMGGIEEIRENTARTLALLENRNDPGEAAPFAGFSSTRTPEEASSALADAAGAAAEDAASVIEEVQGERRVEHSAR